MKKIFKYIMSAALVLTGMMQLASCNDANDWTVDPSVTKQRPPTSLKVELADSASLNINVTIGTLQTAASYDLQVSESPLSSVEANDASTVKSAVWTFEGITVKDFKEGKYVIKRSKEDNGQFTVEQDKTYYFRARAVGSDGTKSNWFTNGLLYYGGVANEDLAQTLLENSYENNGNLNSTSSLTTPSLMWISDMDVESDALTINWHETDYATAKYLRNETLEQEVDISDAEENPEYTKTTVWKYTWTGLEADKEYVFSLLDGDKNVLATITGKTEFAPDLTISYFLPGKTAEPLSSTSPDFTLKSLDNNGNESDLFIGTFIRGGKMLTKSQKSSDRTYISPFTKQVFQPLSTTDKWYTSDATKYNMIQTKSSSSSIELTIPAEGRLYIYASGSGKTITVTQGSEATEDLTETTRSLPKEVNFANGGARFTKVYVKPGTAKVTWSAGIDFCGIHFVPWEAVPAE